MEFFERPCARKDIEADVEQQAKRVA